MQFKKRTQAETAFGIHRHLVIKTEVVHGIHVCGSAAEDCTVIIPTGDCTNEEVGGACTVTLKRGSLKHSSLHHCPKVLNSDRDIFWAPASVPLLIWFHLVFTTSSDI